MLPYFVLGVGLLIGLLLIGKWYVSAPPRQLAKVLKWVAVAVLGGLTLLLVISGRLWVAVALATALLPLVMRLARTARLAKNYARMAGFNGQDDGASTIRTDLLKMTLDHNSGDLDGEVISGPFSGRMLHTLSISELIELLQYGRSHDAQSVQIVEAYLDRTHPSWRERAHAGAHTDEGEFTDDHGAAMTEADAYRILGLGPGAGAGDIRAAHHRLITHLHPDRGGSSFLAAQVNRARDLLLGEFKESSRRSPK